MFIIILNPLVLIFEAWTSSPERMEHTSESPLCFDSTQTSRCKQYFQVLLDLPKALELTSRVPSDELILYFKLLLKGYPVEPGLSNKQLQLLYCEKLGKSLGKRTLEAMIASDQIPIEALEDLCSLRLLASLFVWHILTCPYSFLFTYAKVLGSA